MKIRSKLVVGTALAWMLASCPAMAEDVAADAPQAAEDEEIVVTADRVRLLEQTPTDTVFGLSKPLLETPRSATIVSDTTLERYGINEVDDLIAISPGTFTASFYGVKGAVNVRGTLAESYFQGFKRIENRGTYATPLGAASRIDIVRGPPTPIYGAGKVGGLINIAPKTGRTGSRKADEIGGAIEFTVGMYSKFNGNAELSVPIMVDGENRGGLFGYVEREDSKSFYRGLEPRHTVGQLSGEFDLTENLTLSLGGMYYKSDGYIQTPGWNRLTQDLIDNQTYFTGRDTTLVDSDGNGRLTPNEVGSSLIKGYFGFPPSIDPRLTLDTGVGTAKLSPRTVFVSDQDFSRTRTNTGYFGLTQAVGTGKVSAEGFYDDLKNQRFVSYGFPADYDTKAYEGRLRYDFKIEPTDSALKIDGTFGVSHRKQDAKRKESYNSGYIILDRRDLTVGATPTDIFDSPFTVEPGNIGQGWDIAIESSFKNTGLFGVVDTTVGPFSLLLGGRYDFYSVQSIDRGLVCYCTPNTLVKAKDEKFSYNASLSVKTAFGLFPYFTYAQSQALEIGQGGDISTGLISSNQYLSDSDLMEGGVKFELLKRTLVGSFAAYDQKRTRLSLLDNVVATNSKGLELEARWLATNNFSFTFAGNVQKTTVKGPDTGFTYIPGRVVGLPLSSVYGGTFAIYNFATSPAGQPGNYRQRSIPGKVLSFYGNYVSDPKPWGQVSLTAGVSYIDKTGGRIADPVIYPDYMIANVSAGYNYDGFDITLNVTNLFDKLYFQPVADVYQDMAALPGRGREVQVTFKKRF